MAVEPWTWDERIHTGVAAALAAPAHGFGWCDRLETSPRDAIVGKVLCVCAAGAIARAVVEAGGDESPATDALELLNRWVDDPTDERFDEICSLIFGEGERPDLGPHDVGWWALRTAMSSVGNYEAGWALASTCGAAERAGIRPEDLQRIAERAVLARRGKAEAEKGTGLFPVANKKSPVPFSAPTMAQVEL